MFSNNANSSSRVIDNLITENRYVFNTLDKRLERHLGLVSENIGFEISKIDNKYKDLSADTMNEYEKILKRYTEKEQNLAVIDNDTSNIIQESMEELLSVHRRVFTNSGSKWNRYFTPEYMGIDIFGSIDRVGPGWRSRVSEEMDSKFYKNEILNKKVFDVDKLVYLSFYNGDLGSRGNKNLIESFMGSFNGSSFIVEIDALLLRYMSTLEEQDLEHLMDTICLILTDKVVRLIITRKLSFKLASEYVPDVFSNECNYVSPRNLFISSLINKVLCDGINGVNNMDDERSMESIVNLADISLKNTSSVYNISKTARLIQGMLRRKNGRPKYIERLMDAIAEHVETSKGDIVSSMNAKGKSFGTSLNTDHINNVFTRRTAYMGTESDGFMMTDIENTISLQKAFEEVENRSLGLFNIIGMESAGSKAEDYRKKTRAEILSKLTSKERKRYLSLENEVLRYTSDTNNCKDVTRKNILLVRSKSISKVISIEMGRPSNTEDMLLLLSMLEDSKYSTDNQLISRDFTRERNSKMYGQFMPSKDWDY